MIDLSNMTYEDSDFHLCAILGEPMGESLRVQMTYNQTVMVLNLDQALWLGASLLNLGDEIIRANRNANSPFYGKIGLVQFDDSISVKDARKWRQKVSNIWTLIQCVSDGPQLVEDCSILEHVVRWLEENPNSPFTITFYDLSEIPPEWGNTND